MRGPYSVTNCEENADLIVKLLDNLYYALLPVIQDAKSTNPSPAYKTFFKDASYAPLVSTLFTNITTGVPMTPPALYSSTGSVSFMCVTAPEQFTFTLDGHRDVYDECMADSTVTAKYIGFKPPKPYVILCPAFFTSGIAPAPPENKCLTVYRRANRFRGNGQTLWLYQMWILLLMATDYYLYTSLDVFTETLTSNANKCLRLSAKNSSVNAYSYVYYAASEFFPSLPHLSTRDLQDLSCGLRSHLFSL